MPPPRKIALVAVLSCCVIVTGCIARNSSGTTAAFDSRKIDQIHKGVSTKDDVSHLFGDAQYLSHWNNCSEEWVYEYLESTYGCLGFMGIFLGGHFCDSSKMRFTLTFQMSEAGVVVDYAKNSEYRN
jgi:hypothetical protein